MRPLALCATVLITATAGAAEAQSLNLRPAQTAQPADQAAALALLNSAAFAPAGPGTDVDPISRLMAREAYAPGSGPVRWTSGQVQLAPDTGLRVSVGGAFRTFGGAPLNLANAPYDTQAYEVTVTRDWPAAVSYEARGFGLDLTPHAGVGMTSVGGSAEAGATIRLMQRDSVLQRQLNSLGVRDGASLGDGGRWYLFAAANGRAVGMNMLHGDQGWNRAGLTTDATSTLTGDTQVGVGWRKGDMQTSFGYIHRQTKGQNILFGVDPKDDSMVAFSFSIRPH